jgi:hypothetical protein
VQRSHAHAAAEVLLRQQPLHSPDLPRAGEEDEEVAIVRGERGATERATAGSACPSTGRAR